MQGYRLAYEELVEAQSEALNNQRVSKIDKKYNLEFLIPEALIWSRIYGVSYILPGYRDGGQTLDQPLDITLSLIHI